MTTDDERLRRESPAYQPDAGWEALEPQAMNVVLSVRFDARSVRRIHDLARQTGRTSGQLIRDWALERLSSLPTEPEVETTAIRETGAPYDPGEDQYEALRQRYRPNRIDILLVGESRPAGGTFFYLANSNLYYATHEAFQTALGPLPPAEDFLRYLQQHGVWLYDLADMPVDRMRGRPRRSAVQARAGELVALLRETKPRLVVAIKKNLAATVRLALDEAGISSDRLRVLPFPLYQWRAEYVESMSLLLSAKQQPHPGKQSHNSSPRPLRADRRTGAGQTQRITEKDIAGGRIRIPAAHKPLLPDERCDMNVDLRGRRMVVGYTPRNGPDRARSGLFAIPRAILAELVEPDEVLDFRRSGDSVKFG